MSQENVEVVRRGHEAFRDSGEEAIFEYLHGDIDVTPVEELPGAETFHGHDGFRRFFQTMRDAFGDFRHGNAVLRCGTRQRHPGGSDDLQRLDRPAGEGRPSTRLSESLRRP
jgi:hypothetical protein